MDDTGEERCTAFVCPECKVESKIDLSGIPTHVLAKVVSKLAWKRKQTAKAKAKADLDDLLS